MNRLLYTFLVLITFTASNAQEITGRIVDQNNNPVSFATIQNGPNNGVISNEEGGFSITLNKNHNNLYISCLGFSKIDISIDELKALNGIITLNEQVNQLDTVFISNSIPNTEDIIEKANQNLTTNYKNDGLKYRIFYRGTEYNQFETLNFEINKASGLRKRELTGVNKSLDSLTEAIKNSQSIDFTDYLADLNVMDKENAKLDVLKATKLIDTKNAISVDKIQEKVQRIFLTYLDTTKTYKLKTGLIKIEDSLSLNNSDSRESSSNSHLEYDTEHLRDLGHEHLHKSQIYDNTTLTRLLDLDLYKYEYKDATVYNDELVHIIKFKPRRSKAKLQGVLYISDETYAVLKMNYKYGKGKRGEKLNLKFLLGIKFVEDLKEGTIIYTKTGNYYQPKYIKEETGSYFYVKRPIKFIENSKKRRKIGFKFLIEGRNRNRTELLVISQFEISQEMFNGIEEQDKTPYQKLNSYDPSIWTKYNALEPLQEMKSFKAED